MMEREARRRLAGLCPSGIRIILAASQRTKPVRAIMRHAKVRRYPRAGLSGLLDRKPGGICLSPIGVLVKRAAGGRVGSALDLALAEQGECRRG